MTLYGFAVGNTYGIKLTVDDGAATDSDVITVTVNPGGGNAAPVAVEDDDYSTYDEIALNVALADSVLTNDSDSDGPSTLTAVLFDSFSDSRIRHSRPIRVSTLHS